VEILRDVSVDWLGKKWYFFGASWILLAFGVIGWFYNGGVNGGFAMGIDFKGGTVVNLKFNQAPNVDLIRSALKPETVGATIIQRLGKPTDNAVMVRMETVIGSGQNVDETRKALEKLLRQTFDPTHLETTLFDFNNVGGDTVAKTLLDADPDNMKTQGKTAEEIQKHYRDLATAMIEFRNVPQGGIIGSLDGLKAVPGANPAVLASMGKAFIRAPSPCWETAASERWSEAIFVTVPCWPSGFRSLGCWCTSASGSSRSTAWAPLWLCCMTF
jgi:preprotein translocase subunit SecF